MQDPDIPTQTKVLSLVMPSRGALLGLIQTVSYANGYMSVLRHDGVFMAMSQAMLGVARQFLGTSNPEGFPHSSLNEPEELWAIHRVFSQDNNWGADIIAAHVIWHHYTTDTYWKGSIHPLHIEDAKVLLTIAEPASTAQYKADPSMRIFYRDGRVEVVNYPGMP